MRLGLLLLLASAFALPSPGQQGWQPGIDTSACDAAQLLHGEPSRAPRDVAKPVVVVAELFDERDVPPSTLPRRRGLQLEIRRELSQE